jgi:hypothetical protein
MERLFSPLKLEGRDEQTQRLGQAHLAEGIRWTNHFRSLWFQRQLLIWGTARVIVQPFDLSVLSAKRDVVKTGNSETLTRVGGGDEAPLCSED